MATSATPVQLIDPDTGLAYRASGGTGGGGGDASAANQTTEIARLTTIRDVTGAVADPAYTSGTGTLVSILKGLYTLLSGTLTFANSSLTATTDRSGSATTTSGALSVAANANRKFLVGQNISAVNIGFNEQAGTAAIGTAGTYTVPAGSSFSVSTNKAVNFVAASGSAAITITEG
jgi:hypothetical protein